MLAIWHLLLLVGFVALSVGRTLALARQGVKVWVLSRPGTTKTPLLRLAEASYAGGLLLWLSAIGLHALGKAAWLPLGLGHWVWTSPPWVHGLGALIGAAALALNAWALRDMGDAWRVGVDPTTPGPLVTTGVFGRVRNPIMVAFFGYGLSLFLSFPTAFMALSLVVIAVSVHFQVRQEERFLARHHGPPYRAYCERVGRYLPRG